MEGTSEQDYAGLNHNFLLIADTDKKGMVVKTLYSYGNKKHLVDVIDNRENGSRRWFIVKNIRSRNTNKRSIEELKPIDVEVHDKNKNILKKVTFDNQKSLYLPSSDPDYGTAPEVPKYGKKVLGIEFSFEVRGQIMKYLNQEIE